ncbi:MAG TPA: hypothetical protein DEO98_06485 [Legionellales bacterium]|nr:hypothetical protein [Legionellales bacterium]
MVATNYSVVMGDLSELSTFCDYFNTFDFKIIRISIISDAQYLYCPTAILLNINYSAASACHLKALYQHSITLIIVFSETKVDHKIGVGILEVGTDDFLTLPVSPRE